MNDNGAAAISLRPAQFPDDLETIRQLFLDYQAGLGIDIATRTAAETLSALGRDTLLQTDPERIRAFL